MRVPAFYRGLLTRQFTQKRIIVSDAVLLEQISDRAIQRDPSFDPNASRRDFGRSSLRQVALLLDDQEVG